MSKLKAVDVHLVIGIGTGDSGQLLLLDKDDAWWIQDNLNEVEIRLSNPNRLREVLNERHERGEL